MNVISSNPRNSITGQALCVQACAIVCDNTCPPEWEEVNNLPLNLQDSKYRLFIDDNIFSDG
jgi:hypothetical protein